MPDKPLHASLTEKLRQTVAEGRTTDIFDIHQALDEMLGEIGFSASDCGGDVQFSGRDPIMPSTMRLGAAAALGLVQQSVVAAALHRKRGGSGQDISIQLAHALRRLAPATERRWELLNGHPPCVEDYAMRALLDFYPTRDGRQVLAANLYPRLKSRMMAVLQCWDDPDKIAERTRAHTADDLESMFEEAGLVMCKVRTLEEFMDEPVYAYLASRPLIEIEKIADSPPRPLPPTADQPLSGIRALGMGHVIAGAGAGRSLASMGADVLNIWRPLEFEMESMYVSSNVGMRSARLDPRTGDGRNTLHSLISGADIFFANRRPNLLEELGVGASQMADLRPGIVHVTMSTHGEAGPWANRVGFDQVAGAVTGMLTYEGSPDKAALPPTVIVNDYLVGWLAATGAMAALMRRAHEGGSYRVHVSLTRVALWILSLGRFDKAYAASAAGQPGAHELLAPLLFEADTPLGRYQGVSESVQMSATPRRFETVLMPRGADRPCWNEA